jgi:hypothetical protein
MILTARFSNKVSSKLQARWTCEQEGSARHKSAMHATSRSKNARGPYGQTRTGD